MIEEVASFSFIFYHFYHLLSFSFIFLHVLSFSFIFLHFLFFLSFSVIFSNRDTHKAYSSTSRCRTSDNTASGEQRTTVVSPLPRLIKNCTHFTSFAFPFCSFLPNPVLLLQPEGTNAAVQLPLLPTTSKSTRVEKAPRHSRKSLQRHHDFPPFEKHSQTTPERTLCLPLSLEKEEHAQSQQGGHGSAPDLEKPNPSRDTVKENSFSTPDPARHSRTSSNTTKGQVYSLSNAAITIAAIKKYPLEEIAARRSKHPPR